MREGGGNKCEKYCRARIKSLGTGSTSKSYGMFELNYHNYKLKLQIFNK